MHTVIEREPRTVIHVKSDKMFDPMGLFEEPSIFHKWIADRFGVQLSPQNHDSKSTKTPFIYVNKAKDKNISFVVAFSGKATLKMPALVIKLGDQQSWE